jgi:hypothetical protein
MMWSCTAIPSGFATSTIARVIRQTLTRADRLRDFQVQRLRGFEIDHQFESGWNLDQQVGRACTLENFVDRYGRLPV